MTAGPGRPPTRHRQKPVLRNLYVRPDVCELIFELAEERAVSRTDIIREALNEYADRRMAEGASTKAS